jgi:acyl-CoA synthetase (AMP-forming)/AMP-acid ligase II
MIFRGPYSTVDIPELPLAQFVLQRASERAGKPAVIDGPTGRALTYGQLAAGVRAMAAGLGQRGFAKGDVFAIWLPNLPEYAIAFLGVAAAGGISTTVSTLYTAHECACQLRDTGAKYLLTIPQFMDRAREAVKQSAVREVFVLGESASDATPFAVLLQDEGSPPEVPIDPRQDLVTLPYSSGTSGLPKGVMLTHYNLVAQLCQAEPVMGGDEKDVAMAVLPFFHIFGMALVLLLRLWRGQTLVSMPRFDLEPFLDCLQRYRVTRAALVPPIVLALARHPLVEKYDLSKLRYIACGAAPLAAKVHDACVERLGCVIGQGFGMTEVSGCAISDREEPGAIRPGSTGVCWPNVEAKIVDILDGHTLGPNERGELCIRGPNVMRGYLNEPEATAQTLNGEGWLHTGDMVYADAEGYVFVVDRLKDLIKYKGYQVAPAELEGVLLSHPAVAGAAVIPSPDEESGEVPKAFVVLKAVVSAEEIIAFVAQRVAPYKRIRRLAVIDVLPVSVSGKLLRRVLAEQERAAGLSGQTDVT